MTAPEREALVNELRDCTAALSDIISCNDERGSDAVPTWVATMLRGVRATIRDALQALSNAPAVTVTEGWKPIKSAPKDNTKVLIYVPPERIKGTDYPAIVMVSRFKGYWWDAGHLKPTHWQALPPPPSTTPQTGSQE